MLSDVASIKKSQSPLQSGIHCRYLEYPFFEQYSRTLSLLIPWPCTHNYWSLIMREGGLTLCWTAWRFVLQDFNRPFQPFLNLAFMHADCLLHPYHGHFKPSVPPSSLGIRAWFTPVSWGVWESLALAGCLAIPPNVTALSWSFLPQRKKKKFIPNLVVKIYKYLLLQSISL